MKTRIGAWACVALLGSTVLARAEEAPSPAPAEPPPVGVSKQADMAVFALLLTIDRRKSNWEPRARAVLITELQGLERLNKRIAQTDPQRDALLRRLAETYAELRARSTLEAGEPDTSEAARAQLAKISSAAHEKALRFFRQLILEHPGYPKLAEARFDLALEVARSGSNPELQRALREVFSNHPTSALAPVAHFAYADVFRLNGEQALATTEYRVILKYPAPNPVLCLTRERLDHTTSFGKLALDDPDAFLESAACERNKGR